MQYMTYIMYRWLRAGDTRLKFEQSYSDSKLLGDPKSHWDSTWILDVF